MTNLERAEIWEGVDRAAARAPEWASLEPPYSVKALAVAPGNNSTQDALSGQVPQACPPLYYDDPGRGDQPVQIIYYSRSTWRDWFLTLPLRIVLGLLGAI